MKPALFSLFLGATLVVSVSHLGRSDIKDKEAMVKQAREAYYNLPRLGVTGYRCEAVTNWEAMLASQMAPDALKSEAGRRGLKALEGVHIWMTVDKSGDPKLIQKIDDFGGGAQAAEAVAKLVQKQESVLTHMAHDLRRHLFSTMLPDRGEQYTLEEKEDGYIVSITEGSSRGTIRMARNFKIADFIASLPDGTVAITPQYIETAEGFLLTGQRIETRTNPHDSGTDSESWEYTAIGGVRIPTKIESEIMLDRSPDKNSRRLIVSFQGCQLQKATD